MRQLLFTAVFVCFCITLFAQNSYTPQYQQVESTQNKVVKVESVEQGKTLYSQEELKYRMAYFYNGSWEQLKQEAYENKTRFFVQFETPWCRVCKKMNHEVFARDQVKNYAQQHFMAYKLDGEQRQDVANLYGVDRFPVILFFDYDGRVIARIDGGLSEGDFMYYLKNNTIKIPNTKYSKFR